MPRAATTHAATLEMLADLGMIDEVIARGLVEPLFRIWDRQTKTIVAEFDFGRSRTRRPIRSPCNASSTSWPPWQLPACARFRMQNGVLGPRDALSQSADGVEVEVETAEASGRSAAAI